ncbi:MAG: PAS domain S-box protein [Bacteroidales bacterium]|nr:PAS domain S-box protein [Bacteroidales bacterium]
MSYSNKTKEQLIKELEVLKTELENLKISQLTDDVSSEGQDRINCIFNNSTLGLYRSTPDGRILMANPALIKMLGYKNFNDLARRNLEKDGYEPSYDRKTYKEQMEKFGKVVGLESIWKKYNGELIYVRENAVAFYSNDKNIRYYEGTVEDITTYIKTVNILRDREEILRNIYLASPYAISLIDLQGNIIDCNIAKEKLYGYNKGELIGKNISIFHQKEDIKKSQKLFKRILKEGFLTGHEFLLRRKNGQTFIGEFSGSVIKDKNGKPQSIVSITHDITCRKQSEELIRQSEEKYRSLFENMLNGLILFELVYDKKGEPVDGRYIEVNHLYEEVFRIKRENILGRTQKEIYGFVDPELISKLMEVIKYNKAVHFDYQLKTVNKILDVYAYSPKKGQIAAIFNDITDRKRVEQELIFEKNLLETFMNNTVDHIYFKDMNSRFVRVNKAWAKARASKLNSDPHRVVGLSDYDFFSKEIAEQTLKDEKSIIESGRPLVQKIEIRPGKNSRDHYISTTKMPFFNADGKLAGTFGISRDITSLIEFEKSLQKSEKELQELNATKDKFFSIVAHDLKNPFGSVMNFANLILSNLETLEHERIIKYVSAIFETSKQGFNLLENLLEWSRSQTGKIIYNPTNLSINSLTESNISFVEHAAAKKEISIQNMLEEKLTAYADPNMTSTVLRNLLSNAVKFTNTQGKIKIYNIKRKNYLELFIEDNGVGIPKEELNKLFKIDEDYTTRGTDNEKGTGLGLIIAKEFVTKNKGEIKVKSKEGKGSIFSFTLPLAQ